MLNGGAAATTLSGAHGMTALRLIAGRYAFIFGALALLFAGRADFARAGQQFPFDRILLLDTTPMRPVKRVPILTVSSNGEATIGLWCKTVRGRVELSDSAIRIEPEPLPEVLPRYMVDGQCSEARMQADQDTLAALTQVTGWHRQGRAVVLVGTTTLRFSPSDN